MGRLQNQNAEEVRARERPILITAIKEWHLDLQSLAGIA
jgi:hypothetical protein